jgi:hypothetical protein
MTGSSRVHAAVVVVASVTILGSGVALAQGGPPLITDDPGTPGHGNWEVNLAVTYERSRQVRVLEAPLLDVNYGVGDHLQLKFEVPWAVEDDLEANKNPSGFGNPEFGVKWRFLDQNHAGVAASIYPKLELDTPDVPFLMPVQVARQFGRWSFGAEVGYRVVETEDDEWIYGIAASYETSRWLELVGEVHGEADVDFDQDQLVFNLGFRYRLTDGLGLLFAAGRSLRASGDDEPDLLLYGGMQFTF